MSRKLLHAASVLAAAAGLAALSSSAIAQPRLFTGPLNTVDGYLDVAPDAYGAWTAPFAGGAGPNDDNFNPAGTFGTVPAPLPLRPVCFSNGFFIFVGTTERELLSDSTDWQAVAPVAPAGPAFNLDTSLARLVLCPPVASDTNADGVNDRSTSIFQVTNLAGTTNLVFQVENTVRTIAAGVAAVEQNYTIYNNAAASITFLMLRAVDGDLVYTAATAAGYATDEVGTSCNGAGVGQFAVQRDRDVAAAGTFYNSTGLVVFGGADGRFYVGGKQNHTPTGGVPAMGFGTDGHYWTNYGIPTTWQNYIPTVGYAPVDGFNAFIPSGAAAGQTQDTFIGLDYPLTLAAGASQTIQVGMTYGQITPAPLRAPCPGDLNGDRVVDIQDLALLLSNFGVVGCSIADLNADILVDISDLAALLSQFGTTCP